MNFTVILIFFFLAAGIYLLFSELFHMPTLAGTKAVLNLTRKKKVKWRDAVVIRLSEKLAKHIHLDAYKRRTLAATLKYADIPLSPEIYYARNIVKAIFRLLLIIPFSFFVPIAIPVVVLWAISGFMDGMKSAEKIVSQKRSQIEEELPRFVSTAARELESSHDVLSILEGYRESAGPVFRSELDTVIADMKSGSQEQALIRMEGRVGSAMLSQVVRGLVEVLRGNDESMYYSMLSHDYQNYEIQNLEKQARKRPGEMKKYSYLMMICFIAMYVYVMLVQVFESSANLF